MISIHMCISYERKCVLIQICNTHEHHCLSFDLILRLRSGMHSWSYFIDLVIYKNITYNSTLHYYCLDFYQHVHASWYLLYEWECYLHLQRLSIKIYSTRNVYYKFSVLTVNIRMQPKSQDYRCKATLQSRYKTIIL